MSKASAFDLLVLADCWRSVSARPAGRWPDRRLLLAPAPGRRLTFCLCLLLLLLASSRVTGMAFDSIVCNCLAALNLATRTLPSQSFLNAPVIEVTFTQNAPTKLPSIDKAAYVRLSVNLVSFRLAKFNHPNSCSKPK